jgi:hypothetical protein
MMLLDPEVGLSSKWGNVAGRGKGDNECYRETKKPEVGECYLETRGGSTCPKVKIANEITCDYVWDNL